MMRTRAKMWVVASDRARRENVPRHILFNKIKFHRGVEFNFASEKKSENCKNIKKVVDKYIGL